MNFSKLVCTFLPICLFLNPSLTFSTISNAKDEFKQSVIQRIAHNYGNSFSSTERRAYLERIKIEAQGLETKPNLVSSSAQTLVLIWIISGVELVRREVEVAHIDGRQLTSKELGEKILASAESIAGSGSIWAGLLGGGAMGSLVTKPLKAFGAVASDTKGKTIFKSLLQSGIGTFGTFLGWEAGSELFSEAVEMIEDDASHDRALHLLPVLFGMLKLEKDQSPRLSSTDVQILNQIASNLVKILVTDDDLRNMWLYNTWRNRIATGDFAVLVTSMAGCSAVGSLAFPGAGTLVGMAFGIVGGVISLFIPQESKDFLTDIFQSLRKKIWLTGDDGGGFFHVTRNVTELLMQCVPYEIKCPPLLKYSFNTYAVEQTVTILADQIWRYDSRLNALVLMKNTALNTRQLQSIRDLDSKISEVRSKYRRALIELGSIYQSEVNELFSLYNEFKLSQFMNPSTLMRYPQLLDFAHRFAKVSRMNKAILEFVKTGLESMDNPSDDYLRAVYKISFYTFNEEIFIRTLQ